MATDLDSATNATATIANAECHECPEGTECDSVGNELPTLMIEPSYFRTVPNSMEVYPCTFGEAACRGGNRTGDDLCKMGYEGPLCDRFVGETRSKV